MGDMLMTNQQGAPEAPKSTALDGKTELFHVPGHPLLVRAVDFNRLYAENETLQQGYDAARLEIDQLRGVTKSKLLAQPVAWMVYLPSIDTQHLYYSQEDMGYVDDVTNHADAEVTPLYEMAAQKAEVAPAGEYPPLPTPDSYLFQHEETGVTQYVDSQQVEWGFEKNNPRLQRIGGAFTEAQMRAYVDTDRAMRAQADSQPARDYLPLPDFDTVEQHIYGACRRYITQDMLEPIHNLIRDVIDADRAAQQGAGRAADEFLSDDATTWAIDPNGIFVGNIYVGHELRPARRRIKGGQHGTE